MHIIMAKAVAFGEALTDDFREYIGQVIKNSRAMASKLNTYGFRIISGGTDNHLMLVDLTNKNITGKQGEITLEHAGMTVNKNMIPFDPRSPFVTSGIRVGTPALTSRGMKEKEMEIIAGFINRAIDNHEDMAQLEKIRAEIKELTADFRLYPELG
jgi:glycine hydroxymethyltransferase